MNWLKKNKYSLILILLCIIFFGLYSFNVWSLWLPNLVNFGHIIFNWPDANANYFFASVFAQYNSFLYPESLNLISDNILHTRSINVFDMSLVPMTFLPALYMFALFFKILGAVNILWLTPALASISVYVLYKLVNYIFQEKHLSFLIALLFLPLAPWLYFANVVMLPTILFIFLLLLAWYCMAIYFKKLELVYWTWGTIFLSLAVLVRPTEFFWLLVTTLLVFYFNKNKVNLFLLSFSVLVFCNFLIMALYLNKLTYGAYLNIGYQNLQTGALPTEIDNVSTSLWNFIKLVIMPFGFDLKLLVYNFYNYFIKIIWPYIIFVLAGLYYIFNKIKNKEEKYSVWSKYILITLVTFVFVLLYYGSWDLADPLVKNLNTISISYIRYFLPLYILVLPLAAYGIKRLFFKENKLTNSLIVYFMVTLISLVSIRTAFYSPHDGLLQNRESVIEYYYQYATVAEKVAPGSIIITDRSDKVFFPKYRVIVSQGDLPLWSRVANLVTESDVYFYSNKTDNALLFSREKAREDGLEFSEGVDIYKNFRLFKINKIK